MISKEGSHVHSTQFMIDKRKVKKNSDYIEKMIKKSDDNYHAGALLCDKEFFASAISRYYYSIFQYIMVCNKVSKNQENKIKETKSREEKQKKYRLHEKTIINFCNLYFPEEETIQKNCLALKNLRNSADYDKKYEIDRDDCYDFMLLYNEIYGKIEKIIQEMQKI